MGGGSTSAATAVGSWAEPVSLLSNYDKLLHFQEGQDPESQISHAQESPCLHPCETLLRLERLPLRPLRWMAALTNSTPKHIPSSSHQGLRPQPTLTQVETLQRSSSSAGCGHKRVKVKDKTQLRKCISKQTLPKLSSGHRQMSAEPNREREEIAKACSTLNTHPGSSWRCLLKESHGGKQDLSVDVPFSL